MRPPLLMCPICKSRKGRATLRALNIHITKAHGRENQVTVNDFFKILELEIITSTIRMIRKTEHSRSRSHRSN